MSSGSSAIVVVLDRSTSQGAESAPETSRQRILRTARDLFVERGYLGVSMQQIADAAGLRKATLYHHFRSKEALFADVIAEEMDRVLVDLESALAVEAPIAERLERLALINYERFAQPDLFQLAREFFKYVPEADHDEVHKRLRDMESVLANLFARAIERGEIEPVDPSYAATMFFHMMMALTTDGADYRHTQPPPPAEAAALVTRVMLHGLGRRPA